MVSVSVLLADDRSFERQAIRSLLEARPDLSIVGVAKDGEEIFRLAEQLSPDVVILDPLMRGLNGLHSLRALRDRCPLTRIVVLSGQNDVAFIARALQHGATGYVVKGIGEASLPNAVKEAALGRRVLSPPISDFALDACTEHAGKAPHQGIAPELTRRQTEILKMAADGLKNSEIAERLRISQRTVENHRASLMRKLDLHNRTELVRHAIRRGLIRPE